MKDSILVLDDMKVHITKMQSGKVMMTTGDENVLDVWARMLDEFPEAVQALTSPDMEPIPEDFEGEVSIIADPKCLRIEIDLTGDEPRLGFIICQEEKA